MKHDTKSEHAAMVSANSVLTTFMSIAAMTIVAGCDLSAGQGTGAHARIKARSIEVTQVPVRHCTWDPLGRTGEDVAMTFVKAMTAGDVAGVDAILSRGKIGINDVICLTENDNVRRGKLFLDKTVLRPPELGQNVGAMYARFLNAYTVTDKYDSALGKNEVIEFYGTPLMMAARAGNTTMVAFLLKQGANPNVFVPTKGVDVQRQGQVIGSPTVVAGARPWAVICALTECYVRTTGKYVESADECAELLLKHGAVMPPANSQGQTALWAAAQARSTYLLEQFVKMGADINHKDDLGMTVADYVSREISVSSGTLRREYEAFLSALQSRGAQSAKRPSASGDVAAQTGIVPVAPMQSPASTAAAWQDYSAEIAAIEVQLRELRMQLADARHDANMNAIGGGTASLTAQMRVMSLIDAIHERERRLSALQEAQLGR